MNALSVKSTTSTGQADAGKITDATLFDDASQYDNTLHSGGPDATQYTIWDLGSSQSISDVGYDYSGAAGGGYAAFSADGLTWAGEVGPFGVGSSGPATDLPALLEGAPRGTGRYVRFRPASPGAGKATCETYVYVGGVRVGGPVLAPHAPTGMAAAAGYTPTQVVWSWVAPTSGPTPDSYNLYTGMFPGSETLRQSGITALSFADTSVVLRVPNSGYVTAVSGGIEGPPSLRAVLTVTIPPAGCGMCPPMF